MTTLSNRIKELRERRGLTQQKVVDMASPLISTTASLSNYETGKRGIDVDILCKLADIFGVTTDYLLGRSDEEVPQVKEISEAIGLSRSAVIELSSIDKDTLGGLNDLIEQSNRVTFITFLFRLNEMKKVKAMSAETLASLNEVIFETLPNFTPKEQKAIKEAAKKTSCKIINLERHARYELLESSMQLIDNVFALTDWSKLQNAIYQDKIEEMIQRISEYARSIGENDLADFTAEK